MALVSLPDLLRAGGSCDVQHLVVEEPQRAHVGRHGPSTRVAALRASAPGVRAAAVFGRRSEGGELGVTEAAWMCCTGNFEFVGEGVEPMIVLHEEEAWGGFSCSAILRFV
jgi:hypothetical protein